MLEEFLKYQPLAKSPVLGIISEMGFFFCSKKGRIEDMDYKYQGVILSKKDVGEADRIYTIYTREAGKIRVLATGVRKPNAKLAGSLEPITCTEIFLAKNRGMGKITGALTDNNFLRIKSDFDLLEKIFEVFRYVEKIISEQEKDEKVFELIISFLEILENLDEETKNEKAEIVTLGFLVKFLETAGYRLEVEKCVGCLQKLSLERNWFSASRGGVMCEKCAKKEINKISISNESIKLLRIFLTNKLGNLKKISLSQKDLKNARMIIRNYLDWGIN